MCAFPGDSVAMQAIVGYSRAERYWIVRNSWSEGLQGMAGLTITPVAYLRIIPRLGCSNVLVPASLHPQPVPSPCLGSAWFRIAFPAQPEPLLPRSPAHACRGSDWGEGGYARVEMAMGGGPGTCGMQLWGAIVPLATERYSPVAPLRPPPAQPPPKRQSPPPRQGQPRV